MLFLHDLPVVLAALNFFDFLIIGIMIAVLTGGAAAARRSTSSAATGERLRRIEDKLNLLLAHSGVAYVPGTKERWQRLAEANDKAGAAKEYCDTHGVTPEEAQEVVDQYVADIR